VTLQDVAERAGVSKTAAAAALSGKWTGRIGVSEQTRLRVLDVARELRYRPNAVARSLSARATNVVGYYSSWRIDARNDFDAELMSGLLRGCHEGGKNLLVFDCFSIRDEERAGGVPSHLSSPSHATVTDGKIDGLAFRCHPDDPLLDQLRAADLPAVSLADVHAGFPAVTVDEEDGFRRMAEYLAHKGHRRVLFRGMPSGAGARRADLFGREAAAHGMTVLRDPEVEDYSLSPAERGMLGGSADRRPTAVACWSDPAAYYTLFFCDQNGLRVPDDIAVIGFNGMPELIQFPRRLTTIRAPWAEAACTAVGLLDRAARADGGPDDALPPLTVLPVCLFEGDTA
jgi:DNA-binding LacI/PurR family transcriptional regulator